MSARGPLTLDFPEPLAGLIASCETQCVTGCCNLDAYEVAADHLVRWMTDVGLTQTLVALTRLEYELAVVGAHDGSVHGTDMLLCWEWDDPAGFLAYMAGWRTAAIQAIVKVGAGLVFRSEWQSPTVRAVAAGIVADRDFSRLPILADALEDAGCDSQQVLTHLRADDRHGWFCWAADLFATP